MYLAPADIQLARVDRQAIVYFCSALQRAGADVELVSLGIRLDATEQRSPDPLDLYDVETRFAVRILPTSLHQRSPRWRWGLVRLFAYARFVRSEVRADREQDVVFYLKNYAPALVLLAMRRRRPIRLLFEAHTMPKRPWQRWILRRVDGVVANSGALASDLLQAGIAEHVLPTHQGIDLGRYRNCPPRNELRRRLGLHEAQPIVAYTGKIFRGYEEIDYILRAAAAPALADVQFVLVGGRADHTDWWRREAASRGLTNVTFTGFVQPRDVHEYQLAADALVLYYPTGVALSSYLSPGKLFAYMASGVPIVAVDLPVLREVLGEPPAATLVAPDSPDKLADAIRTTLDDSTRAAATAAIAGERVERFTWDHRAALVLAFIERLRPTTARDQSTALGA